MSCSQLYTVSFRVGLVVAALLSMVVGPLVSFTFVRAGLITYLGWLHSSLHLERDPRRNRRPVAAVVMADGAIFKKPRSLCVMGCSLSSDSDIPFTICTQGGKRDRDVSDTGWFDICL